MRHQCNFYFIVIALAIYTLLMLYGCKYFNHHSDPTLKKPLSYVETVLEKTRLNIKLELWDYNFPYSGATRLEDLLMESGGSPVRSVIVSTWRSGSTFLGDLVNSMPSNYYHYEPLIKYKNIQIREPLTENATRMLKNMLNCDYSDIEDYFEFGKVNMRYGYYMFNTRLWETCKYKKELCVDPNYSANFCKLFPFQNMKTVRIRLRYIEPLLQDEKLNIRVVLLIRDPRAVMHSRIRANLCVKPDCSDPGILCSDMVSDHETARQFLKKYPDRIMVLRFEDLIMDLYATTSKLFKFLRLKRTHSVEDFLSTHTTVVKGNAYSTFRVSSNVPFMWKNTMNFSQVSDIQKVCKKAMDLWGYQRADNVSHMSSANFTPLKPYTVKRVINKPSP